MSKSEFWSGDKLRATGADYMIAFGERSSGKTYDGLMQILKGYIAKGEQGAIVRRWQDDFIGKRGQVMFDSIVMNGEVEKLSGGAWSGVAYYASKWYLTTVDEEGKIVRCEEPFCYGFALTAMQHDKSTSYPKITTIVFDEFIERSEGGYLPDEFVIFCNVLSTIIRNRTNVRIYLLGNTINRYCPYFKEFGLKHIDKLVPGQIDVYTYGDGKLKVAVEYTAPIEGKESNYYFAFDNPKLNMIKSGEWELDIYPHKPMSFDKRQIMFIFFIIFDDNIYQCEVVTGLYTSFIYIHRKTGDIKNPDTDIIYCKNNDVRMNWRRSFMTGGELEKKIRWYFDNDRVYYQDNEVGDSIANYLNS